MIGIYNLIFRLKDKKYAHNTNEQKGVAMKKYDKLKLEIMTRELRLIYYNDYLLKNDIISKREHEKMYLTIISEYG